MGRRPKGEKPSGKRQVSALLTDEAWEVYRKCRDGEGGRLISAALIFYDAHTGDAARINREVVALERTIRQREDAMMNLQSIITDYGTRLRALESPDEETEGA